MEVAEAWLAAVFCIYDGTTKRGFILFFFEMGKQSFRW